MSREHSCSTEAASRHYSQQFRPPPILGAEAEAACLTFNYNFHCLRNSLIAIEFSYRLAIAAIQLSAGFFFSPTFPTCRDQGFKG